ncbi:hypothetical protein KBY57_14040, partial [Cyanobium sp. Aljojuca 7D2]|nr:hypothetical protein [Cyanobium sp. Aljojuca 7D2]
GQFPDPPQWMTGRDPLLDRHVGEQRAAALPVTSHLRWAVGPLSRGLGFSANSYDFIANASAYGNQLMLSWQPFLWQELKDLGAIP